MKWGLEELRGRLANIGAELSDIVDYTVFLTDPGDLYEFDSALRAAVDGPPPSRTVIPSRGFALPRREDAFGHEDGAPRMEVQFRIRRPQAGLDKEVVDGPGAGFGYQSAAVKLGPLVWISSQVASPEHRGNAAAEVEDILAKIASTCANAGTDLSNLLRVRVLLTRAEDAGAFADALRAAVPSDPPTVCVAVVPTALPAHGATVAIDAVAFASG